MNAIHRGTTWSTGQLVGLLAVLMLVTLFAGGAGGYLFRGASTPVVTQPVVANPVPSNGVTGPLTEPHDVAPVIGPLTAAGQGPLTEPHEALTPAGSGQGPFTEPHEAFMSAGSGQGPFTEPHEAFMSTGSGQGPLTEPHDVGR